MVVQSSVRRSLLLAVMVALGGCGSGPAGEPTETGVVIEDVYTETSSLTPTPAEETDSPTTAPTATEGDERADASVTDEPNGAERDREADEEDDSDDDNDGKAKGKNKGDAGPPDHAKGPKDKDDDDDE